MKNSRPQLHFWRSSSKITVDAAAYLISAKFFSLQKKFILQFYETDQRQTGFIPVVKECLAYKNILFVEINTSLEKF